MSRRKQSNPKPIKHDGDEDDRDGTGSSHPGDTSSMAPNIHTHRCDTIGWEEPHGKDSVKYARSYEATLDSPADSPVQTIDKTAGLLERVPSTLSELDSLGEEKNDQQLQCLAEEDEAMLVESSEVFPAYRPSSSQRQRESPRSASPNENALHVNRNSPLDVQSANTIEPKKAVDSPESNDTESPSGNWLSKNRITEASYRDESRVGASPNAGATSLPPSRSPPAELVNENLPIKSRNVNTIFNRHQDTFLAKVSKNDAILLPNHIHTDDNDGALLSPKPSSQARFPIIPNGKSSNHYPRSLHPNKHDNLQHSEHSNRTVNTDGSDSHNRPNAISDLKADPVSTSITKSTNKRESPTDSPKKFPPSDSKSSSSASPHRSLGGSKEETTLARSQEEAELALVNQLQLPSDVLYLRQQEVNIHGMPNLGWVVCCAIPLPQGSSLGPFQGQLVAPEEVNVGDLIVQFTNRKGHQALMNVAGQSGGWLALLRAPRTPGQRNTHVYWEGGRIWCEIISDIDMGTELRASFSFQHDEEEEEEEGGELHVSQAAGLAKRKRVLSGAESTAIGEEHLRPAPEAVKVEQQPVSESSSTGNRSRSPSRGDNADSMEISVQRSHLQPPQLPPNPNQQQPAPGHAALIYGCPFCGVRFSSPRTLQGHLSFYCSKKSSDSRVYSAAAAASGGKDKGNNQVKSADGGVQIKEEPRENLTDWERAGIKRRASDTGSSNSTDVRFSPSTPPPAKMDRPNNLAHPFVDRMKRLQDAKDQDLNNRHNGKFPSVNRHKNPDAGGTSSGSSAFVQDHSEQAHRSFSMQSFKPERRITSALKSPSMETFCKECKIQFSSMHTFKCHKEHYCAQRRKKALTDPSPFAAMFNSPFPFTPDSAAATAGIPSALQMSALSQGGLVLPGERNQAAAAAAAAAAMILQANMAAMTLPGMLMHPQKSLTASGLTLPDRGIRLSMSPPMSAPRQVSRGSSPVFHLSNLSPSLPKKANTLHKEQPLSVVSASSPSKAETPRSPIQNYTREERGCHSEVSQHEYKRVKDHRSSATKERKEHNETERPLDLSVAKQELDENQDRNSSSHFSQNSSPTKNQTANCSPLPISSSPPSSIPESETQDRAPTQSPRRRQVLDSDKNNSPRNVKQTSTIVRPELLSPGEAQAHLFRTSERSPLLLPPPGFLSASAAASASLPPLNISPIGRSHRPESPPALAKTISKCLDCNIVFYKHDNYLIHKKHYCSGKRRSTQSASRSLSPASPPAFLHQHLPSPPQKAAPKLRSPIEHPENVSPPSPEPARLFSARRQEDTSPPTRAQHVAEVKYKFYCVPCKIKFSNASILEAHKEYYCPAGKDSEHSVILHNPYSLPDESHSQVATVLSSSGKNEDTERRSSSPPELPPEEVTCTRCNSVFTSARLLRLHVCDGGFPCPHCDHVAITENRLAEHLKAHAPTRAYRCTICGYRGNTARGMRMHGKSHIDEGLDFTDENMLEYQEPAVMPILSHAGVSGLAGGSGLATDSELLRMKNEPYKRRRSRKAYEKFDFPLPKVDIPQTCPLCGQNFANSDYLASHFKVHQIAASQYLAGLMKCIHCPYVGKSPEDLRSHFEANHASNHRIHLPQRVSLGQANEAERGQFSPNEEGIQSPEHEQNRIEPPTHMVITDPNSPLNEDNPIKTERDCSDDERISSPWPKSKGTVRQDSPSHFMVKVKEEPREVEEDTPAYNGSIEHFLHMPNAPDLINRKKCISPSPNRHSRESRDVSNRVENGPSDRARELSCSDPKRDIVISAELPMEIFEPDQSPPEESRFPPVHTFPSPHGTQNSSPSSSAEDIPHPDDPRSVNNTESHPSEYKIKPNSGCPSNSSPVAPSSPPSLSKPHQSKVLVKQEPGLINEAGINLLDTPSPKPDQSSPRSHLQLDQRPEGPQIPQTTLSSKLSPSTSLPSPSPTVSSLHTSSAAIPVAPLQSPNVPFPGQHLLPHHALPFPYGNPQALPFFFLPSYTARLSSPASSSHAFPVTSRDDRGSRYCQNCDISFSKQATYLAHKKYYCTARPRGEPQPSATA